MISAESPSPGQAAARSLHETAHAARGQGLAATRRMGEEQDDPPRQGKRTYEPSRPVRRGGRVSLLESLIGDIMSLCGPAQIGELASHDAAFGNWS